MFFKPHIPCLLNISGIISDWGFKIHLQLLKWKGKLLFKHKNEQKYLDLHGNVYFNIFVFLHWKHNPSL